MVRAGNAGANTACDQIAVAEAALEQVPTERIEVVELLLRVDSAGATHELLDRCREGRIRYSGGFDLTEPVREAILALPEDARGARRFARTTQSAREPRSPSSPTGWG